MRPTHAVDPADRLRIERAVFEAEQRTAGEIVVVIARACASYDGAGWRCGALLAALVLLLLAALRPDTALPVAFAAQALAVAAGHVAVRSDALRRLFVSEARFEAEARRAAAAAFAEHGLARTAGQTGTLLFVGLLEHRVVVLGDVGVDRVLDPDESWQEVVELVLAGVRGRSLVDGVLSGVERLGAILARHLPAVAPNPDELPRALVLLDDRF